MGYGFYGPSLRQRLLGYAVAGQVITVVTDAFTFSGRVINVDCDAFEMTVVTPGTSGLTVGAIVTVSFRELNAISVP